MLAGNTARAAAVVAPMIAAEKIFGARVLTVVFLDRNIFLTEGGG
jgi:hypothetical protein